MIFNIVLYYYFILLLSFSLFFFATCGSSPDPVQCGKPRALGMPFFSLCYVWLFCWVPGTEGFVVVLMVKVLLKIEEEWRVQTGCLEH